MAQPPSVPPTPPTPPSLPAPVYRDRSWQAAQAVRMLRETRTHIRRANEAERATQAALRRTLDAQTTTRDLCRRARQTMQQQGIDPELAERMRDTDGASALQPRDITSP